VLADDFRRRVARDALRAAMLRILGDTALRADLGARGVERAKQFRWERSAKLMSELLAEAANA